MKLSGAGSFQKLLITIEYEIFKIFNRWSSIVVIVKYF